MMASELTSEEVEVFEHLVRGGEFTNGEFALVRTTRKVDGKPVALIVFIQVDETDPQPFMVQPVAQLVGDEFFHDYNDPGEDTDDGVPKVFMAGDTPHIHVE